MILAYYHYLLATVLCYYFNAHVFWFSFLKSWSGSGHLISVRASSIRASHAARPEVERFVAAGLVIAIAIFLYWWHWRDQGFAYGAFVCRPPSMTFRESLKRSLGSPWLRESAILSSVLPVFGRASNFL